MLKFLPAVSVARWASDLDLYFEGLIAETSLLETGAYPSLSEYMIFDGSATTSIYVSIQPKSSGSSEPHD